MGNAIVKVHKAEFNGIDISFIRDFIYETLEKEGYTPSSLSDNGAIYYMNGNDGTSFDYYANHRTCEFCVRKKDESVLLSAMVEEDKIHVYVYNGPKDVHEYEAMYAGDLRELCNQLWKNFDYFQRYNEVIKSWKLKEIFAYTFDVDMQIGEQISFSAKHYFCTESKAQWDRYVDFAKQSFGVPQKGACDKVYNEAVKLPIYVAKQMAEKMASDAAFREGVLNYLGSKADITRWLNESYEDLLLACRENITFVGLSNIKENADMME